MKAARLLTWADYVPADVVAAFKKETGIDVELTLSNNEEMISKLRATGGAGFDLAQPSQDRIAGPQQEFGIYKPMDMTKIKTEQFIGPMLEATKVNTTLDGKVYGLPHIWGTDGLVVNTKLAQMRDYPDLCKPEYKGKTSMRLKRPTLLAFAFASGKDPFALYKDPKAYTALMDEMGKTLIACKPIVKFYWDNKDQLLNAMRTQEIVGAMMWDTGGWKLNDDNPDIRYIAPRSGALGWIDTFALPAKGRNDAAAYAWINFNMRPEIAAKVAASAGNFTASKGADHAHDRQAQGCNTRDELSRIRGEEHQVVSGGAARHRGHRRQGARSREGGELGYFQRPGPGGLRAVHPRHQTGRFSRAPNPSPVLQDLEVDQVVKRFGAHVAVDGLSFAVPHGSFFSILGPSGCGKTTLLRLIAGFLEPDAGDIRIGGQSMRGVPPNRRPANMVFQHLALFPMMSVGQNVGYGLARRGVARAEMNQRVAAMLRRVGLPGAERRRIDELSGGQKQRVAIARCLVLEPKLLLLDEPLGALDLKLREHMKIELKQLQAEFGTTFVYITHDQSEALVLSDRVAVMHAGRFEQVGTPQELYYEPHTPIVAGFVGNNNRFAGRATNVDGDSITVESAVGLRLQARGSGAINAGDAVEAFVRPEVVSLARDAAELAATDQHFRGTVASLLFDGANSAVLVREQQSSTDFRIALPQTGRYADLRVGEIIAFGFDPQRAISFRVDGNAS